MDKSTFDALMADAPKFNQRLVKGLAVSEMDHIEEYIERRIFRVAAAEFPPQLEFLGGERCSMEEMLAVTKERQERQKKATYETAPSDYYLMRYMFRYEGQKLAPLYLLVPFVGQAGTLMIRGSLFHVTPVVADRSISVGTDSIFLPVSRARMNFSRISYHFRVNSLQHTHFMVYAKLHNKTGEATGRGRSALSNLKTTMTHYLFAQYGYREAFQKFCNAEIRVGYPDTINPKTCPPDQWVICSSRHDDPRVPTEGHDHIKLAIRRQDLDGNTAHIQHGLTRATLTMVAGFFYLADHFPDRVIPEYVEDRQLWIILLGQLLFGSQMNVGMLAEGVLAHLNSLMNALDPDARDNLQKIGIECENLYDVLANLNDTFSERVSAAVKTVPSMYGKQYMVLRYILSDLAQAVNKFMFQMTKDASNRKRPLTAKDIAAQMKRHIKWDILFKISGSKHQEVVSVSVPGDNMLFKLTSLAVLQSESNGPRSRTGTARGRTGVDASLYLDVSIASSFSYNTMSKSEPSGRSRPNPYSTFTEDGVIYMDPAVAHVLDPVQALIGH